MKLRAGLAAVAAWTVLAVAARALPSAAPTVAFAVGDKDQAAPLMAELTQQLKQSHRFVPGPALSPLPLDVPLETMLAKLRKVTKAPWVFVGTVMIAPGPTPVASATPSAPNTVSLLPPDPPKRNFRPVAPRALELRGRLYDLVLGDASKELRFVGTEAELGTIARQLVAYFRSQRPLRGEVTGMRDSYVLLNLGAQDGVELGSVFQVSPRQIVAPTIRSRVRVVDLQAWFCTAELLSATSSLSTLALRRKAAPVLSGVAVAPDVPPIVFQPGDGVIEDVGYTFITPPKPKDPNAPVEEVPEETPAPEEEAEETPQP